MKLAIITPIPHLNDFPNDSNFVMVLGHLLKNRKYSKYYKDLKKEHPDTYILCDNSANEGYMIKGKELISLATKINANEIIAPDKYHDAEITKSETIKFLDEHYEKDLRDRFNVMAVPQGDTLIKYTDCYNTFINDPRINTIGIGYRTLIPALMKDIYLTTPHYWEQMGVNEIRLLADSLEDNCFNYTMSRLFFIRHFVNFIELNNKSKQIHLLGLYNPIELKLINKAFSKRELTSIRSCDSAAPWQAAQANVIFNEHYGVSSKPKAYLDFEYKCDNWQRAAYEHNIKLLRKWAENTPSNGK
jgi:hypothetical protein